MIDSIKKRFLAPRFPMLCLVLVALFNGLAAWSVPPLSPSSISFAKNTLEAREGDTIELELLIDPLPKSDIEIEIHCDGPAYGTVWQFGPHRDMREAANEGFVLRIPEGRRSMTLPIPCIDDGDEKTKPDSLKVNLVHVTPHTEPGEFSQVIITLRDPYVPPVVQIAEDIEVRMQEGGTLSVPIIASGKVEEALSIPISLSPGAAKDIQVGSGETIRFGEGMNQSIVDLSAIEDRLYEGEEKVFIRLEEGERYVLGEQRELEVLIADGDQPPVFKIRSIQAVFGHDEAVRVKLQASVPSAKEKRVDYNLHNASDLPEHILPPDKKGGHFVMPAGEDAVVISVLDPSTNWPRGNHQLEARIDPKLVDRNGDQTASFTVTHTPAALSPSEAALAEGVAAITEVTVMLPDNTQAAKNIDLRLRFSGNATYGDDYELVGGLGNTVNAVDGVWECPLTIPEGQREVSFQLRAVDDAAYEGEEPERIEIEIIDASAGIDRRHNVSLLSIRDNESVPQLAIEWGGNTQLKEGEAGEAILSIPETAQVEVPIEGMLEFGGEAEEGKHFKIGSKKFMIKVGDKNDSLTLRATDDRVPERENPRKSLQIGVDEQGLKNALAPQRDLHLYIVDDDKWEGGTEVLILVAMTDAMEDTKIEGQINSALQLLASEDIDLIGGGVQWFDAKKPATPRDWPGEGFPDAQMFFKQRDIGAILGVAQTIEASVAERREGREFVLLLIYPLVEKSNRPGGDARFEPTDKDKQEVHIRKVLIVGRVGRDNEINGNLLHDIGQYSKKQPARAGPTAKDLKQAIINQINKLKPKN